METIYVARRAFVYAGRQYQAGERWEATGNKADAAIIRSRLVVERPPARAPKAGERKAK